MGPELEFSVVDENLKALPIADKIIKDFSGKTVNFVKQPRFTFGKELQLHVLETKANLPFKTPGLFEENMQSAVTTLANFIGKKYHARLLGTGMHPLLRLEEAQVWPHRHIQIYREYDRLFNIRQHGWLNIQSFHLNLPYSNEATAISLHNLASELAAYLPAITASSPVCEGEIGLYVDNRLHYYRMAQSQVPSIIGDLIPEPISSFHQYREEVIGRYSKDLRKAGAGKPLLYKEWVNSRGVILRFVRNAMEIRIMDEQECVKSDVALSCFIRAALRGLLSRNDKPLPHRLLVNDFNAILSHGLNATVLTPRGETARQACQYYLKLALENSTGDERKYLWIIEKRIKNGNLSELIRDRILNKNRKTDLVDAVNSVYTTLTESLINDEPYF